MGAPNTFIIKALLLLCVVCAVLCEHQKRDVHRIVIKQRVPRSHKKGHSHTHDHKRGRHHSSRSHGHSHKKSKKHPDSYEKDSPEDVSYSNENNFEDIFKKHKGHKSHHTDSKKSYSPPSHHVNHQDYQESRQTLYKDPKFIFQNEWTPLSSEQILPNSHESYRERHKKRDSRKSYLTSLNPPPIDLTTSYPLQFESSSIYPQLIGYQNAFANFDIINKKIMESNQSPLIGTIEHPNIQFNELNDNYNRLKNHRASYEVTELTPAENKINTIISVPDDSTLQDSVEEVTTKASKQTKEEVKSTQRPIRSRGRATFRAQNKA